MEEKQPVPPIIGAMRYFLYYFLFQWGLELFLRILQTALYPEDTENPKVLIHIFYFIGHCGMLFWCIKKANKDYVLIVKNDFFYVNSGLVGAVFIGLSAGTLLPLIGTLGYFFEPNTMLHDTVVSGIKSFAENLSKYSLVELVTLSFFGTILFSVYREMFFRGILFKLFRKEMNVTKSTVQVSLLFTICYFGMPLNQLDFLSPLVFSTLLCFLVFKSESVLLAIVASIAYDFPVYFVLTFDDVHIFPEKYFVFNSDFYWVYFVAILMGIFGFRFINQRSEEPNG